MQFSHLGPAHAQPGDRANLQCTLSAPVTGDIIPPARGDYFPDLYATLFVPSPAHSTSLSPGFTQGSTIASPARCKPSPCSTVGTQIEFNPDVEVSFENILDQRREGARLLIDMAFRSLEREENSPRRLGQREKTRFM